MFVLSEIYIYTRCIIQSNFSLFAEWSRKPSVVQSATPQVQVLCAQQAGLEHRNGECPTKFAKEDISIA